MKAIKVMGTVDKRGQLTLDSPLTIDEQSRVEVIVLISEKTEAKEEILDDFRSSWQEAKNGKTIPVEKLWEDFYLIYKSELH